MALPPLTREGIRPFLSDSPNQILQDKFRDDRVIPHFFAPEGVLLRADDGVFNVRMFWHRNEANAITGIFIRIILEEGSMIAWIMPNAWDQQHNMIWIRNNQTKLTERPIIGEGFPFEMQGTFGNLQDPNPHDVEPVLNIREIDTPEAIAAFFDQDREVLPESLRVRIFPPAPQNPLPLPQNNQTYLYMGAALLLLIGIAILAKDYFNNPEPPTILPVDPPKVPSQTPTTCLSGKA
ncbi:MAG: hypothetical protein KDK69_06460 [Chlamydiia bacterium]|nr:hypothetical protein [Chlamydiia bacterium]